MYVFDTNSFIELFGRYPKDCFPSLWNKFEALIQEKRLFSIEMVRQEILTDKPLFSDWLESHKELFLEPTTDEATFVGKIFQIKSFQNLVKP
ncbi:MAG: DUF4411 family protein, partial [Planctomycetota bacterium]